MASIPAPKLVADAVGTRSNNTTSAAGVHATKMSTGESKAARHVAAIQAQKRTLHELQKHILVQSSRLQLATVHQARALLHKHDRAARVKALDFAHQRAAAGLKSEQHRLHMLREVAAPSAPTPLAQIARELTSVLQTSVSRAGGSKSQNLEYASYLEPIPRGGSAAAGQVGIAASSAMPQGSAGAASEHSIAMDEHTIVNKACAQSNDLLKDPAFLRRLKPFDQSRSPLNLLRSFSLHPSICAGDDDQADGDSSGHLALDSTLNQRAGVTATTFSYPIDPQRTLCSVELDALVSPVMHRSKHRKHGGEARAAVAGGDERTDSAVGAKRSRSDDSTGAVAGQGKSNSKPSASLTASMDIARQRLQAAGVSVSTSSGTGGKVVNAAEDGSSNPCGRRDCRFQHLSAMKMEPSRLSTLLQAYDKACKTLRAMDVHRSRSSSASAASAAAASATASSRGPGPAGTDFSGDNTSDNATLDVDNIIADVTSFSASLEAPTTTELSAVDSAAAASSSAATGMDVRAGSAAGNALLLTPLEAELLEMSAQQSFAAGDGSSLSAGADDSNVLSLLNALQTASSIRTQLGELPLELQARFILVNGVKVVDVDSSTAVEVSVSNTGTNDTVAALARPSALRELRMAAAEVPDWIPLASLQHVVPTTMKGVVAQSLVCGLTGLALSLGAANSTTLRLVVGQARRHCELEQELTLLHPPHIIGWLASRGLVPRSQRLFCQAGNAFKQVQHEGAKSVGDVMQRQHPSALVDKHSAKRQKPSPMEQVALQSHEEDADEGDMEIMYEVGDEHDDADGSHDTPVDDRIAFSDFAVDDRDEDGIIHMVNDRHADASVLQAKGAKLLKVTQRIKEAHAQLASACSEKLGLSDQAADGSHTILGSSTVADNSELHQALPVSVHAADAPTDAEVDTDLQLLDAADGIPEALSSPSVPQPSATASGAGSRYYVPTSSDMTLDTASANDGTALTDSNATPVDAGRQFVEWYASLQGHAFSAGSQVFAFKDALPALSKTQADPWLYLALTAVRLSPPALARSGQPFATQSMDDEALADAITLMALAAPSAEDGLVSVYSPLYQKKPATSWRREMIVAARTRSASAQKILVEGLKHVKSSSSSSLWLMLLRLRAASEQHARQLSAWSAASAVSIPTDGSAAQHLPDALQLWQRVSAVSVSAAGTPLGRLCLTAARHCSLDFDVRCTVLRILAWSGASVSEIRDAALDCVSTWSTMLQASGSASTRNVKSSSADWEWANLSWQLLHFEIIVLRTIEDSGQLGDLLVRLNGAVSDVPNDAASNLHTVLHLSASAWLWSLYMFVVLNGRLPDDIDIRQQGTHALRAPRLDWSAVTDLAAAAAAFDAESSSAASPVPAPAPRHAPALISTPLTAAETSEVATVVAALFNSKLDSAAIVNKIVQPLLASHPEIAPLAACSAASVAQPASPVVPSSHARAAFASLQRAMVHVQTVLRENQSSEDILESISPLVCIITTGLQSAHPASERAAAWLHSVAGASESLVLHQAPLPMLRQWIGAKATVPGQQFTAFAKRLCMLTIFTATMQQSELMHRAAVLCAVISERLVTEHAALAHKLASLFVQYAVSKLVPSKQDVPVADDTSDGAASSSATGNGLDILSVVEATFAALEFGNHPQSSEPAFPGSIQDAASPFADYWCETLLSSCHPSPASDAALLTAVPMLAFYVLRAPQPGRAATSAAIYAAGTCLQSCLSALKHAQSISAAEALHGLKPSIAPPCMLCEAQEALHSLAVMTLGTAMGAQLPRDTTTQGGDVHGHSPALRFAARIASACVAPMYPSASPTASELKRFEGLVETAVTESTTSSMRLGPVSLSHRSSDATATSGFSARVRQLVLSSLHSMGAGSRLLGVQPYNQTSKLIAHEPRTSCNSASMAISSGEGLRLALSSTASVPSGSTTSEGGHRPWRAPSIGSTAMLESIHPAAPSNELLSVLHATAIAVYSTPQVQQLLVNAPIATGFDPLHQLPLSIDGRAACLLMRSAVSAVSVQSSPSPFVRSHVTKYLNSLSGGGSGGSVLQSAQQLAVAMRQGGGPADSATAAATSLPSSDAPSLPCTGNLGLPAWLLTSALCARESAPGSKHGADSDYAALACLPQLCSSPGERLKLLQMVIARSIRGDDQLWITAPAVAAVALASYRGHRELARLFRSILQLSTALPLLGKPENAIGNDKSASGPPNPVVVGTGSSRATKAGPRLGNAGSSAGQVAGYEKAAVAIKAAIDAALDLQQ